MTEGNGAQPFSIPVFGINAAVLPTGKVMWYAYPAQPALPATARNESDAYLWDPAAGTGANSFTQVTPPLDDNHNPALPANIWCSGLSFLADGRLLVTGGNLQYGDSSNTDYPDFKGLNSVYTFNPFSGYMGPAAEHGSWPVVPDPESAARTGRR